MITEHRAPKAPKHPLLTLNQQSRQPQLPGTPQLLSFEDEATTKRCSLVILKGSAVIPGEFPLRMGQEIHTGHGRWDGTLFPRSKASRCTDFLAVRH